MELDCYKYHISKLDASHSFEETMTGQSTVDANSHLALLVLPYEFYPAETILLEQPKYKYATSKLNSVSE